MAIVGLKVWLVCEKCGEYFSGKEEKEGDRCPDCNDGNLIKRCGNCGKTLEECKCTEEDLKDLVEDGDVMKWEITWAGQKYLMEWLDHTNFEELENVIQSYGFIFDKEGKICIVDCNKGYWSLPGGKPEDEDDTFEETLIREVDEEADLDIKNIKRVGCFKCTALGDNCERKGVTHILRYIAEVEKIKEQTIDPAENAIPLRKFIDSKDFLEFVKWDDNGEFQLKKALEKLMGER
jgi:8-oxo-dGTP pyrophosphatase MutT (NUDIX family)